MNVETASGIFGVPTNRETAKLVLVPVPWDLTTSYGKGTSNGPQAIFEASHQVDLFDRDLGEIWKSGYHMLEIPAQLASLNGRLQDKAQSWVEYQSQNPELVEPVFKEKLDSLNSACEEMVSWVYDETKQIIYEGKMAAVIGGDHSVPFGAIKAYSEKFKGDFGILHIDAHADLREAYQSFVHSHASIMYNAMYRLAFPPRMLVQVGVRDFSSEEFEIIQKEKSRIKTFFDPILKEKMFEGHLWQQLAKEIIEALPKRVYVSFDVDGLSPDLCPQTGTPVPGGLSFDQAIYLIKALVQSGREIVGFDLNEVAKKENSSSDWDANVGARILFKLSGWAIHSQKRP